MKTETKHRDIEPMCASGGDAPKDSPVWDDNNGYIAEEKLDGARYILHLNDEGGNTLFSRRRSVKDGERIEKSNNVPHLMALDHKGMGGTILDGEIVVAGVCTSSRVTRIMGSSPEKALTRQVSEGYVHYKVFDIIQHKGKDLCGTPYHERRKILETVVQKLGCEYISLPRATVADKFALCEKIWAEGGEGVIIKHPMGLYEEGYRSSAWFKIKRVNTWNVICTGFTTGTGKYADLIGAIVFSIHIDGVLTEVGQCSGMNDKIRTDVANNKDEYLGKVFEVQGQEMTEYGRVRHPRFKRWRTSLDPKGCTVEDESKSC